MNVGDIIEVLDNIDYSITHKGTIRMIEQDDQFPDINWIYIRANDESLNIQYDPRIGNYWTLINANYDNIVSISPATM